MNRTYLSSPHLSDRSRRLSRLIDRRDGSRQRQLTTRTMTARRCIGWIVAGFLAATALPIVLMLKAGHWLALADSPTPADAIVVLGGESLGFPRVQHALALYRAGRYF